MLFSISVDSAAFRCIPADFRMSSTEFWKRLFFFVSFSIFHFFLLLLVSVEICVYHGSSIEGERERWVPQARHPKRRKGWIRRSVSYKFIHNHPHILLPGANLRLPREKERERDIKRTEIELYSRNNIGHWKVLVRK